jgi:hypothetical protein
VNGTLLYRFGRVRSANNTTTRWNGVGIGAAEGTPVRAVAGGEVMVAEQIGTYGVTVILQHGGGDYSVYGSLGRADVRKGQTIARGRGGDRRRGRRRPAGAPPLRGTPAGARRGPPGVAQGTALTQPAAS